MTESWKKDPRIQKMGPAKIQFVESMAKQLNTKKQNEVLPFLMAVLSAGKKQNINFSNEEAELIIELVMPNQTVEDKKRLAMLKIMAQTLIGKK